MSAPVPPQPANRVPGSGQLDQRGRFLAAQVHAMIPIAADTMMVKVLAPAALPRYLAGEVSAGQWGSRPPFDHRTVGGTVARRQDTTNLHTPAQWMQAFRLDYPGSPFQPAMPILAVLEFLAGDPSQYRIPLGAPSVSDPQAALPPQASEVRQSAYAMVGAAEAAALDPNTYRQEIAPWPFTGTGLTAGGDLAVPERWRPYGLLPRGAVITEFAANGQQRTAALYRGTALGWKDVR